MTKLLRPSTSQHHGTDVRPAGVSYNAPPEESLERIHQQSQEQTAKCYHSQHHPVNPPSLSTPFSLSFLQRLYFFKMNTSHNLFDTISDLVTLTFCLRTSFIGSKFTATSQNSRQLDRPSLDSLQWPERCILSRAECGRKVQDCLTGTCVRSIPEGMERTGWIYWSSPFWCIHADFSTGGGRGGPHNTHAAGGSQQHGKVTA